MDFGEKHWTSERKRIHAYYYTVRVSLMVFEIELSVLAATVIDIFNQKDIVDNLCEYFNSQKCQCYMKPIRNFERILKSIVLTNTIAL